MNSKPKGGYPGYRDASGLTPRQLVDQRRAMLIGLEIAEKQGQLVKRSEVEAEQREAAEVLQSDLFGFLPNRLTSELAGRAVDSEAFRLAVLAVVEEMVRNWQSAGVVK